MLSFISIKLCDAAAAATRADFECHKDGLCTGGWCTDGEMVVEFWSVNLENFIFHHVTAFIQCDSKSLAQLQGELLLPLNVGDKTGKEIFAQKIMLTIIIQSCLSS